MISERRLLRAEPDFGLLTKLFRVHWVYVAAALRAGRLRLRRHSTPPAAAPSPTPGATACVSASGLVMALSLAMMDIRFLARFSLAVLRLALVLLVLALRMGHVGKGAERWLEHRAAAAAAAARS